MTGAKHAHLGDDAYSRFAKSSARFFGRPRVFVLSMLFIVLWALAGPIFGFSEGWQLIINTATNVVTFFMVFLIQNTQNRDTDAMHVKLDELIRVTKGAHNTLLGLEDLDEKTLNEVRARYQALAQEARGHTQDTDCPEV